MKHRAHRHLVATLTLIAALAGSGCELITRADEYAVYEGLCNTCPKSASELRHAPCPNDSAIPNTSERYVYAARKLYFGKPADWEENAATFALGYDMDCSNRPNDGRPVLCKPRAGATDDPWLQLPRGIDNSLATRIFGPLYETAAKAGREINLDETYSADQEVGRLGTLVVIDEWNGTPDDPAVVMSIYSSPGVSDENGPPRWDGTDEWDRYSDVPGNESKFFKVEAAPGYVANGVLVVDYRSRGDISYRFGSPQTSFRIIVREVSFIGFVNADRIDNFNMIAVAPFTDIFGEVDEAAKVLASCDPIGEAFLKEQLKKLLIGAADMPANRNSPVNDECDGITFAWALDGRRAKLAGFKEESALPDAGCL
jgi:hypothetical protein